MAGSATAWAVAGSSGPAYRVATVGPGTVQQTLDLTGTLKPVSETSVSFQVSGTVAAIDVSAGQTVTPGQTLATLNASSLSATAAADQSTLSSDQSKLAQDEQTEANASSSNSSSSSQTSSALTASQQRLVSDQKKADVDSSQASSDLKAADSACQGGSSGACTTALEQELSDEQQVSTDQATVAKDEDTLGSLLNSQASQGASPQGSASQSSFGGRNSSSSSSSPSSVTPATIADDQAQIDAEQAALDQADQSLADATLTSPIAGQVAQLGLTVGEVVGAGSSSAAIVVQGPSTFEVVADVTTSQLGQLHPGEKVLVTPDGSTGSVAGTVGAVNTLPASSSDSDTVTVTLPSGTSGLYNGANADIQIVTGTADAANTVPTSALHALGTRYFVDVVANDKARLVPVTVGAIGDTVTEIRSGLHAGQQVELADANAAVPTSSSNNPRSILSLTGGGGAVFFRPVGGRGGSTKVQVPAGGG